MPMRDYEDLKNLKIPAEQERIMDIICDAWDECRSTDCQSECKDNQVLPCEHILFACTALKYSRKIYEAGYAPLQVDRRQRPPAGRIRKHASEHRVEEHKPVYILRGHQKQTVCGDSVLLQR